VKHPSGGHTEDIMLAFNKLVFDNTISGTAGAWYSPCVYDDLLGTADALHLMVHSMGVTGTSPTITCRLEHSANGRNWSQVSGTAEINAQALVIDTAIGSATPALETITPYLRFVRVKITLGGTSPSARLRIYAIGRVSGGGMNRQGPAALQYPGTQM
jgi:hypothetical protein